MKIVHIADIHVSAARYDEFVVMLKQLADSVNAQNPDVVVIAGDLFVHRDKLTPNEIFLVRSFLKEQLDCKNILVIVGNHDISMSTKKIDSMTAIFQADDLPIYTEIGSTYEVDDYVFHMFPYATKAEFSRLGINRLVDLFDEDLLNTIFKIDPKKKNVLIYHGVLENFNVSKDYSGSEDIINTGSDQIIPEGFWSKFDAVMAGHLHRYQSRNSAIYPGVPFPLAFSDSDETGYILWEDLNPTFVPIEQQYPFLTYDLGYMGNFHAAITDEAVRRLKNDYSFERARIKIKYGIHHSQSGIMDHPRLAGCFRDALDIKITPVYSESKGSFEASVSFDDFKEGTVSGVIMKHIDQKKLGPVVKEIAELIEARVHKKFDDADQKGINFRLVNLNIDNFKCFGPTNPVINFDELQPVIGVFGPNKTGKSSFVEAIVWGLFGATLRNKDVNSIIRNGEKQTTVEVVIESHGIQYKIIRERGKKNTIFLYTKTDDSWVDISETTMRGTQERIEKIVGTFDIFISTVYSPQNNIDLLVQKKPSERKQIIIDLLQIEVLDRRLQEIINEKKVQKEQLLMIKGKESGYKEELTKLINDNPKEQRDIFVEKLDTIKKERAKEQSHLKFYLKKVDEYEGAADELDLLSDKIDDIRKKIREVDSKIFATENKKKEKLVLAQNPNIIQEKLRRIQDCETDLEKQMALKSKKLQLEQDKKQLIDKRNTTIKSYNEQLELLTKNKTTATQDVSKFKLLDCSKGDCPLNKQIEEQRQEKYMQLAEIDESISLLKSNHNIRLLEFQEEIKLLDDRINDIEYDPSKHMETLNFLREADKDKWIGLSRQIETGEEVINTFDEIISAYTNQKNQFISERDALYTTRTKLSEQSASLDKYKSLVSDVESKLSYIQESIVLYESNINRYNNVLDRITDLQRMISSVEKEIRDKELYIVYCNKYHDVVSRQGVIYSLVDKAIPVIEKFAQDILSETANGLISLSIDSYKTVGRGKDRQDEVMIYISDSKGKRDVLEASGAENVLASLALRAAMSNLLSLRMGSQVQLFIVDEGFGVFDDENKTNVKFLLKVLSKKFTKILFITHVTELKDAAQSIINLYTRGNVSKYSIIKNTEEGVKYV